MVFMVFDIVIAHNNWLLLHTSRGIFIPLRPLQSPVRFLRSHHTAKGDDLMMRLVLVMLAVMFAALLIITMAGLGLAIERMERTA